MHNEIGRVVDRSVAPEAIAAGSTALKESNRIHETDKHVAADVSDANFANRLFLRLVAKSRSFKNVDFKYSIFDTCYLRGCAFDSCDFTGCRFSGTSLHGSTFSGCKFDYAMFERTLIDSSVLDTQCPGFENLKQRFARTLRMNFQQLGDAHAVNKAVKVELEATEAHLKKAWWSNESYYRKKYASWRRVQAFLDWVKFKALDHLWGNGESAPKLLRAALIILLLMTLTTTVWFKDGRRPASYWEALCEAPQVFFGTLSPRGYASGYLTAVVFIRLVIIALFLAIIVKRYNRR